MERAAEAAIKNSPGENAYAGRDYEWCSRFGLALIVAASKTGQWFNLPEHLSDLRQQMGRFTIA